MTGADDPPGPSANGHAAGSPDLKGANSSNVKGADSSKVKGANSSKVKGADSSHWQGAHSAELSWDDGVPRSTRFEDSYFSSAGGVAESRHVFLAGNKLPQRWRQSTRFTIVETGFGTGLNFLTTWQAWRQTGGQADGRNRLHYLSIEAYPLTPTDLQTAASAWPELGAESAQLAAAYPPALPGMHRIQFGNVCLDLVYAELGEALDMLLSHPELAVDAWYLDGFAPARNPDMWTPALYRAMATLGSADSSFATFTAAGEVRRGLAEAGFKVEKSPGFGRKREMLRGRLQSPAAAKPVQVTPWHLPRTRYPDPERPLSCGPAPEKALVLGAGLAGACAARALAERGVAVEVLDAGGIAGGASGNPQGALYTRLSHRDSALTRFALHSFLFASRHYRGMLERGELQEGLDGALCGALQLRPGWGSDDVLFDTVRSLPGLVQGVDAAQAAELTGIAGCGEGLYYPGSGWLDPAAVCRAQLAHAGIKVREHCGPLSISPADAGWQLLDDSRQPLAEAPVLVVACGTASAELVDAAWLQLQAIRGQTSQLCSAGALKALKTVICHEGYLPPARDGEHCLGATFDIGDTDSALRPADHQANLTQLASALPALAAELPQQVDELSGRVGYRCATPDYLPVAGPVPDTDGFGEDYAALRRNARQLLPHPGSYRPGLYFSAGHGSRGLTSTPLCGELLAAQICAEPWPLPAPLARALAPARFFIRGLKRNRL